MPPNGQGMQRAPSYEGEMSQSLSQAHLGGVQHEGDDHAAVRLQGQRLRQDGHVRVAHQVHVALPRRLGLALPPLSFAI